MRQSERSSSGAARRRRIGTERLSTVSQSRPIPASAFAQNVRGHRGGCRFAVHAGDDNAALSVHDRGKRFGAAHDRFSRIARAYQNWIVDLNRGGKHNQISFAGIFRAMLGKETQTQALQSIRLKRADFIRAAHVVPKLEQKRGDAAHAAPGYADEMNPMVLTREQFWQVGLRDGLHGSYIFPWS